MITYKCFFCGKQVPAKTTKGKIVCSNCNSRVFFKPRTAVKKVKAV